MAETYLLVLRDGTRHNGVTLDEVRRILIDDCHYSYAYVQQLVNKAHADHTATVEWVPGRNMNWVVDGVRMGRKCALFALEWKGHSEEEAECLMRCAKLSHDVDETRDRIRKVCKELEEDIAQYRAKMHKP